jgi:ribosomal protein L13E
MPSIVGGLDIHRKQLTFDYLDTVTGEVKCGQVAPADREHFRSWLARFEDPGEVAFAAEACTGWRYVSEELRRAGIEAHLAELFGAGVDFGARRNGREAELEAALDRFCDD